MELDLDNGLTEQVVWAVEPFQPLATESGDAVSHEQLLQRPDLWPSLRLVKAAQVTPGFPAVVLSTWSFSLDALPGNIKQQLCFSELGLGDVVVTGTIPSELAEGIAAHAQAIEPIRTWREVLQGLRPAR